MKDPLSELARDHIEKPRNRGKFPQDTPGRILQGEAGSATSGAFVRVCLQTIDASIVAVRYELLGPPELIALASFLSEKLEGCKALSTSVPRGLELARELDLPRTTHGLALLAEDAALRCFQY